MLLAGHLAKIQGLKGEFLFHSVMDDPARLEGMAGLVLTAIAIEMLLAGIQKFVLQIRAA